MSAPYSTIGPYAGGVWLVAKNGQAAVTNSPPAEGQGFTYYWLGSNPGQANSRILDALNKLNVHYQINRNLDTTAAFNGTYLPVSVQARGIIGWLQSASQAVIIPPISGATAAAITGTGATAADTAAGTGGALGKAGTAGVTGYGAKALQAGLSVAKNAGLAALLIDPRFLWRVVRIAGGLFLFYLGAMQLRTVANK